MATKRNRTHASHSGYVPTYCKSVLRLWVFFFALFCFDLFVFFFFVVFSSFPTCTALHYTVFQIRRRQMISRSGVSKTIWTKEKNEKETQAIKNLSLFFFLVSHRHVCYASRWRAQPLLDDSSSKIAYCTRALNTRITQNVA